MSPPTSDGVNGASERANGPSQSTEPSPANGPRPARTTDIRDLIDIEKKKFSDKKNKIKSKASPPGGFDPTPLPDAPQGYTLKFTFHKAYNLPTADLQTNSADPFIHATLTAPVPRRHQEEPPLTRRTRTIRKSTEPVWKEEWIVANIPSSGFTLKCRLYDEDYANHDDRLGNVTIKVAHVDENWEGLGPEGCVFDVKKRSGSKRYYLLRGITSTFCSNESMTPRLHLGIEVLGKSDPPHAQMYTVGPTGWVKHFSPMIGRLTGTKVNKNEEDDAESSPRRSEDRSTKKYDFQANEIQLSGPVPPKLYHRYVEFRPVIGLMFSSSGLRGRILNKALHKQHSRVYNFDSSTEHGSFPPRSKEAAMQFLKMAHFDEGGRIFTYVITLDGMLRFTETGREFGIDLLSKHTMHSDVATYIACSGEFFIRRLAHADGSNDPEPNERTHPPDKNLPGGPPNSSPPRNPKHYQLIIDNDSGTYRPDKSVLPELKKFLEDNFPGLGIVVMHCEDRELAKMKKEQMDIKNKEGGPRVRMVLNRSPSASSFSSDDESRLGDLERAGDFPVRSKKERVFDVIQDPNKLKEMIRAGSGEEAGEGSGGVKK
ncbi:hypothetical protein B0T16DRAFT_371656 [Cercophora newfieldiana]|uniref:C2 domain-containing protein n=1 Tax=Cercophora newfieldiana TaxID=92897 RepID=A0AA40CTY6_9PEZI|nr:hypothetical protein B0T16DRAFT_371656 [Cercophora newfieldiana]